MAADTVLVLEPGRAEKHYWHDLWRYRELFLILSWRDVSVRYKQTMVGVLWAVLRPFLTMVVFTAIFGKLANLPSDGDAPYALMVFVGMLPWYLFSTAVAGAGDSLVANSSLIGKVYFPRLIVPASTLLTALIDFLISFVILVGLMVWYRFVPGWHVVFLPFFAAFALLASLGPGLWITALNVKYRDFRHAVPFLLQFGLYISPVGFSSNVVPTEWRLLYSLNPMVGAIDGFRWCILGDGSPLSGVGLGMNAGVVGLFLWAGLSRFRRMERTFADLI